MPLDNETPKVRNTPRENEEKDKAITAAHEQAEQDIEQDVELNGESSPEDDLDEGELARFEDNEKTKDAS